MTGRATFCFPDSAMHGWTGEPQEAVGPELLDSLLAACSAADLDDLDRYVEAHVHRGVLLGRDVEAVVLDPCFARTQVEAAARRTRCAVEWHPGYRVEVAELDPGYRGREHVEVAAEVAVDGVLTPDLIGAAARGGEHDPQAVKRVWHLLARFGRPAVHPERPIRDGGA